jgi:hypothetical protein
VNNITLRVERKVSDLKFGHRQYGVQATLDAGEDRDTALTELECLLDSHLLAAQQRDKASPVQLTGKDGKSAWPTTIGCCAA